eukprot:1290216-Rhodomonas_salina.2
MRCAVSLFGADAGLQVIVAERVNVFVRSGQMHSCLRPYAWLRVLRELPAYAYLHSCAGTNEAVWRYQAMVASDELTGQDIVIPIGQVSRPVPLPKCESAGADPELPARIFSCASTYR